MEWNGIEYHNNSMESCIYQSVNLIILWSFSPICFCQRKCSTFFNTINSHVTYIHKIYRFSKFLTCDLHSFNSKILMYFNTLLFPLLFHASFRRRNSEYVVSSSLRITCIPLLIFYDVLMYRLLNELQATTSWTICRAIH